MVRITYWIVRSVLSSLAWRGAQLLFDYYSLIPQISWVNIIMEPSNSFKQEFILWLWAGTLGVVSLIIYEIMMIPKKRRRRQQIIQWRQMMADVSKTYLKRRAESKVRTADHALAMDILTQHKFYPSYEAVLSQYESSGMRLLVKWLRNHKILHPIINKIYPPRPPSSRIFIVGEPLATVLVHTKQDIAKIERWWGVSI